MPQMIIELNILYLTKQQLLDETFFKRTFLTYKVKNVYVIDNLEECNDIIQKNTITFCIAEFSTSDAQEIPKFFQYIEDHQIHLPLIIITDAKEKMIKKTLTHAEQVYYIDINASLEDIMLELEKKITNITNTSVQVFSNAETFFSNQDNYLQYKIYFDVANDGIAVCTLDTNNEFENFIDVNEKICNRLEYTHEELLKMKPGEITNKSFTMIFQRQFNTFLTEKYLLFETTAITHRGKEFPVEINARLFDYNNKKLVILNFRDITERKSIEQALIQQKEALREFAHITAHDLRNPLTAIYGYTNLLKQGYETTYVDKILLLTQNMLELIKKSLALADAGMSIGSLEPVDLNECVKYVIEHTIPKDVSITLTKLPVVKGDRQKLIQMFQNLLDNAVTHGEPKLIQIEGQNLKDTYQLIITNDGKEIPSYVKEKMFKQKLTTKKETGGYGLLIVQKVVESHNWEITLVDSPKTSFQITIPSTSILETH